MQTYVLDDFAGFCRSACADVEEGQSVYCRIRIKHDGEGGWSTAASRLKAAPDRQADELEVVLRAKLDELAVKELQVGDAILIEAVWSGTSEKRCKPCRGQVPERVDALPPTAPPDWTSPQMMQHIGPLGGAIMSLTSPMVKMLEMSMQHQNATFLALAEASAQNVELHKQLAQHEATNDAAGLLAEQDAANDATQRMYDLAEGMLPKIIPIIPLLMANAQKRKRKEDADEGVTRDPVELVDELLAELAAVAALHPEAMAHLKAKVVPMAAQWVQAEATAQQAAADADEGGEA